MSRRKKQGLARLWQLVTVLDRSRTGLTVAQLTERLGMSRATVYRYLDDLKEAGVALDVALQTGEQRYRLRGDGAPAIIPTPRQLAALHFARAALGSWEGTDVVEQLDVLLSRWGGLTRDPAPHTRATTGSGAPALLRTIDQALNQGKRLAIEYRGAADEAAKRREIDPLSLHERDGTLYLMGYDHARRATRSFKVARIVAAQGLELPISERHGGPSERDFERSVKVWRGAEPEQVVVRLSPAVARFAKEYPLLCDQHLGPEEDGSVLVRATVSGITEAMRWVLSWGKDAEALAPQSLRDAVRTEVEGAASRYAAGKPKGGLRKTSEGPVQADGEGRKQVVSREVRR